jgi:hypothetical protein
VDRIAGAREHHEERVALRAQLMTAVRRNRTADDSAVLVKNLGVALAKALEAIASSPRCR